MPDFTVEVASVCESVTQFRVEIDGFRVYYGETPYGRYRYNWECGCGDESGACTHVHEAKKQRCGWNKEMSPNRMPEDRKCPDCGGPLDFIKVAV